jgi:flagellin
MGLRINTNIQSMAAQRSLGGVRREQDKVFEQLSSGSRINKAADDAAGLAISEKLKAEIRSTRQANRNAGDGVSMVQTAEGGLNEISNILVRLRELSIQTSSDTVGDAERKFSDLEFQQLVTEVDRISHSTKFGDRNLLDGQGGVYDLQIGTGNNSELDRISYVASDTNTTASALGVSGLSLLSKESSQANLEKLDTAINAVSGSRAGLGALQNRLQSTINNLEVKAENLSSANSRVRDTDVAEASAALAKTNILSAGATSVLAQANTTPQTALKLI